jgi:hypothetical protein
MLLKSLLCSLWREKAEASQQGIEKESERLIECLTPTRLFVLQTLFGTFQSRE